MGTPYKMKGSPMKRNFGVGAEGTLVGGAMQATKGKLKKTFTGPIKPMTDKDGDGIPIGVDAKDTPGGKQSNPPKRKPEARKPKSNKSKKGQGYSDKNHDYKSTDFLKTDYASGHGVGDLTTIKRLNKQNQKRGKDYKDN